MFAAFLEGWRRVLRARVLSASIILAVLLLAWPLLTPYDEPATPQLGNRLEAETAVSVWHGHDLRAVAPSLMGAAGAYTLLWVFLSGGILDRVARRRPVHTAQFFAACGVYFVRFLRLGLLVGPVFWALFWWVHPALPSDIAFVLLLGVVSAISDFAKVRAVVEDRRSMLGAVAAAVRFIRRRPLRTAGLYALNVVAAVAILLLWAQIAPSAGEPAWLAFLLGHLFLAVRILARLAFMASEVAFFQSQLAHAEYTAAPELVWPDSPAVEAIRNLSAGRR